MCFPGRVVARLACGVQRWQPPCPPSSPSGPPRLGILGGSHVAAARPRPFRPARAQFRALPFGPAAVDAGGADAKRGDRLAGLPAHRQPREPRPRRPRPFPALSAADPAGWPAGRPRRSALLLATAATLMLLTRSTRQNAQRE